MASHGAAPTALTETVLEGLVRASPATRDRQSATARSHAWLHGNATMNGTVTLAFLASSTSPRRVLAMYWFVTGPSLLAETSRQTSIGNGAGSLPTLTTSTSTAVGQGATGGGDTMVIAPTVRSDDMPSSWLIGQGSSRTATSTTT